MKTETLLESARELLRNHRYKSSMGLGMRGLMDHHVEALAPEIAAFAAERETLARDEEREACAKDVCTSCRNSDVWHPAVKKEDGRFIGEWRHVSTRNSDVSIYCDAARIRARKER